MILRYVNSFYLVVDERGKEWLDSRVGVAVAGVHGVYLSPLICTQLIIEQSCTVYIESRKCRREGLHENIFTSLIEG